MSETMEEREDINVVEIIDNGTTEPEQQSPGDADWGEDLPTIQIGW